MQNTNAKKAYLDTKVERGHCVSAWGTLAPMGKMT